MIWRNSIRARPSSILETTEISSIEVDAAEVRFGFGLDARLADTFPNTDLTRPGLLFRSMQQPAALPSNARRVNLCDDSQRWPSARFLTQLLHLLPALVRGVSHGK